MDLLGKWRRGGENERERGASSWPGRIEGEGERGGVEGQVVDDAIRLD